MSYERCVISVTETGLSQRYAKIFVQDGEMFETGGINKDVRDTDLVILILFLRTEFY